MTCASLYRDQCPFSRVLKPELKEFRYSGDSFSKWSDMAWKFGLPFPTSTMYWCPSVTTWLTSKARWSLASGTNILPKRVYTSKARACSNLRKKLFKVQHRPPSPLKQSLMLSSSLGIFLSFIGRDISLRLWNGTLLWKLRQRSFNSCRRCGPGPSAEPGRHTWDFQELFHELLGSRFTQHCEWLRSGRKLLWIWILIYNTLIIILTLPVPLGPSKEGLVYRLLGPSKDVPWSKQ